MKRVKDKTLLQDKDVVSYYHLHKFDKQYDEIIKTAYEENSLPEVTTKKRGRKKKEEVEEEEESADNSVVVSKEEQSATLALLKSLASHSVGVKQHDNTAASK